MAEERNARSVAAFDTLCRMLDARSWHYTKNEQSLTVEATAQGDDLPIELFIRIQEKRNVVLLISKLPYVIQEDKRLDVALAITAINNLLVNGCFDLNMTDGQLFFRLTNSFVDCTPSEELFRYMVMCTCHTVDEYNDKLLMIAKGMLPLEKFLESISK